MKVKAKLPSMSPVFTCFKPLAEGPGIVIIRSELDQLVLDLSHWRTAQLLVSFAQASQLALLSRVNVREKPRTHDDDTPQCHDSEPPWAPMDAAELLALILGGTRCGDGPLGARTV